MEYLIEPLKAISDWELDFNLGYAVCLIIDSQQSGRNEPLKKAIEFLEAEMVHNQEREKAKFKAFADYIKDNPDAFGNKICRDSHSDE